MARYIDAEQVIPKLFSVAITTDLYGQGISAGIDQALRIIKNQPTADVAEVKHGEWIYNVKYYSCSICAGKRFNLLLGTDAEYCPYCGAKMDGGNAE